MLMPRKRRLAIADSPIARLTTGDATTLLTIFIVMLIGIPSRYVFAPLGGAGAPAELVGMTASLWWLVHRMAQFRRSPRIVQPVRRAMLIFSACVLASYVAATVRPIDASELSSADRGLLLLIAWLGLVIVGTDGIPNRERLDTLLRRLVAAGGAVATLGLVQFKTGLPFTNYLKLPGLSENNDLTSVAARDGFLRPAGTAIHPIEFGVALNIFLPLALHYALADTHRNGFRRWYPALALALCVPVSVSRSAVVCLIVGLGFMIPSWSKAIRRRAYVAIVILLGFVYVAVPGMLGTILGLFTGIGNDSSAASRTGSYGIAWEFISRAPVFGRGFSTFLPGYRILDNQYLGTLIELGFVGLAALIAVFISGIVTARLVRRRSDDPSTRQLSQALTASIAAGAASFALFDAFSFPMIPGLMFLLLGTVGALRRVELLRETEAALRLRPAVRPAHHSPPDDRPPPVPAEAAPATSADEDTRPMPIPVPSPPPPPQPPPQPSLPQPQPSDDTRPMPIPVAEARPQPSDDTRPIAVPPLIPFDLIIRPLPQHPPNSTKKAKPAAETERSAPPIPPTGASTKPVVPVAGQVERLKNLVPPHLVIRGRGTKRTETKRTEPTPGDE